MRISTNINNQEWLNPDDLMNIRAKGCYPDVQKPKHPRTFKDIRTFNQHKPYGMVTAPLDPYDDRPDWYVFKHKHKRKYYEEIMPRDQEFTDAIEQDHDMHIPLHHTHIKPIEPNTRDEEIGDTIIL